MVTHIKVFCYSALVLLLVACELPRPKQKGGYKAEPSYFDRQIEKIRHDTTITFETRRYLLEKLRPRAYAAFRERTRLHRLFKINTVYRRMGDSLRFKEGNHQLLALARKKQQYLHLGNAHWNRAAFFRKAGQTDSALYHYQNAPEKPETRHAQGFPYPLPYRKGTLQYGHSTT